MKWLIGIVLFVCSVVSVEAANLCDPVNVGNCATVNTSATGGGIHITPYNLDSNRLGYFGQRATYRASVDALTNTAVSSGPIVSLCGSSIKIIHVQKVVFGGTIATTAARLAITVNKINSAPTGGTALGPPPLVVRSDTQMDPESSKSAMNFYTTPPTGVAAGLVVGAIASRVVNFPITATFVSTDKLEYAYFYFNSGLSVNSGSDGEEPILRGPTECLTVILSGAATVPTVTFEIVWNEEEFLYLP